MPRRWPSEVDDVSQSLLVACMDVVILLDWASGSRASHVYFLDDGSLTRLVGKTGYIANATDMSQILTFGP